MKNLIKKFKNKTIQNNIITNSKEFISFARTFKNDLKKILKEINGELISFTIGHYFISAFIRKNEKIGYISYHLDRNMPVNIEKKNILYRTAESCDDFYGGKNKFTSIQELEKTIKNWEYLNVSYDKSSQKRIEWFDDKSIGEKIHIIQNLINNYDANIDDDFNRINEFNDEEIDSFFSNSMEAIRAWHYGSETNCYTDDYFFVNAYGNIETMTESDVSERIESEKEAIIDALNSLTSEEWEALHY